MNVVLFYSLLRMKPEDCHNVLEVSLSVLRNLTHKILDVQFLKAFIDCVLITVSKYEDTSSSAHVKITAALNDMKKCIALWIEEPMIIGGNSIGGSAKDWKGKKELEVVFMLFYDKIYRYRICSSTLYT